MEIFSRDSKIAAQNIYVISEILNNDNTKKKLLSHITVSRAKWMSTNIRSTNYLTSFHCFILHGSTSNAKTREIHSRVREVYIKNTDAIRIEAYIFNDVRKYLVTFLSMIWYELVHSERETLYSALLRASDIILRSVCFAYPPYRVYHNCLICLSLLLYALTP